MDPNATLDHLRDAIARAATARREIAGTSLAGLHGAEALARQSRLYEARQERRRAVADTAAYAEALVGWLDGGGFLPDAWRS
jgi:hypothetical protein